MTQAVQQLLTQALTLSPDERAELAHSLWDSLEPGDVGVEEAWRQEVARRMAEIRAGRVQGRPVEGVLAEMRARHQ